MPSSSGGHLGTEQDVILPRVGAFIIDHVVSFVVAVAIGLVFGLATGSSGAIYLGVLIGVFGYFIVLEGLTGQTLGKMAFGVIVVKSDGSAIGFGDAAIRNILRLIDGILTYAVGLVVMLLSDRRQRVGDHAAGTVVVRKR